MISPDEYKVEICSITDDECNEISCDNCYISRNNRLAEEWEEKEREIKEYTIFDREIHINGIPVNVNCVNVIAKTNIETLEKLQNTLIIPKTEVIFSFENIPQHCNQLIKLISYNPEISDKNPDKTFVEKDKVAAFIWGQDVYLIAPRIEND